MYFGFLFVLAYHSIQLESAIQIFCLPVCREGVDEEKEWEGGGGGGLMFDSVLRLAIHSILDFSERKRSGGERHIQRKRGRRERRK